MDATIRFIAGVMRQQTCHVADVAAGYADILPEIYTAQYFLNPLFYMGINRYFD
jgi:hypothetical protein